MKHLFIAILFLLPSIIFAQSTPESFADSITKTSLRNHVFTLASKKMNGRYSGEEGQKLAAEYIQSQYIENGLMPIIKNNDSLSYYQKFELYESEKRYMKVKGDAMALNCYYYGDTDDTITINKVWFLGEGDNIEGQKFHTNDLLIFEGSSTSHIIETVKMLKAGGGKHFLVITTSEKVLKATSKYYHSMNGWKLEQTENETVKEYQAITDDCFIGLRLTDNMAKSLKMTEDDFKEYQTTVKETNRGVEINFGHEIIYQSTLRDTLFTENVLGYIPADLENAEWIVITAHYDHVGSDKSGIYYGADDNASGTAAIMELAAAISKAKKSGLKLKYNFLFIAFSAEELGLLGSEYFINHSPVEIDNMALNINLDMIGKSVRYGMIEAMVKSQTHFSEDTTQRKPYVYVLDNGRGSAKYTRNAKRHAKKRYEGFKVDKTPGLMERLTYKMSSDHHHFHKADVPILVFFTGIHPDYHTPRDKPGKLDYNNMTKIVKLIYLSLSDEIYMTNPD